MACWAPADAAYARLRADLEQCGRPIGGNDLLIAAHPLALWHPLVSDNEREVAPVAGRSSADDGAFCDPPRICITRIALAFTSRVVPLAVRFDS